MKQDRHVRNWKRGARPVRPDFAALVAVAVARQSASPTARILAEDGLTPAQSVSLVELFGAERARQGAAGDASFNTGVAALLSPRQHL